MNDPEHKKMILITGAAGKTGKAAIRALVRHGEDVRALIRREAQREIVVAAGARETMVGDMADPLVLHRAVTGVSAIYHICPNMHPHEVSIGRHLLAAGEDAGVKHFVYHSVLHPQTEKMPHHWSKLQVEALLLESGLPFTILQPTAYMQNLLASWQTITEQGTHATPYPVTSRLSLVDLEDVAEVATAVLTQTGHTGATYELAGTAALSQTEVADVLAQGLKRPVRAREITPEAWRAEAEAGGKLPAYAIDTLHKMFVYYAHFGLVGNANVIHYLLGRKPTTLAEFVERTIN